MSGSSTPCYDQSHSVQSFTLPVTVQLSGVLFLLKVLIDSGSAGNFMNMDTTINLNIPIHRLSCSLRIPDIDGKPIGEGFIKFLTIPLLFQVSAQHQEEISFLVIVTTKHSLISLGCVSSTPKIPGGTRKSPNGLTTANNTVFSYHSSDWHLHQWRARNSLHTYPFPLSTKTSVISSAKANGLPPHRPYDSAIELLPGSVTGYI